MYLNKNDLNKEIASWQSSGSASDLLVSMLTQLFNGVCYRYGRGLDWDDITQECLLKFFASWGRKIALVPRVPALASKPQEVEGVILCLPDVKQRQGGNDGFGFLTTCAVNMISGIRRNRQSGINKGIASLDEMQEANHLNRISPLHS